MARFRVREDARQWFSVLRDRDKTFKTDFDGFYFCFMAGIATSTKKTDSLGDTAELVDYFPDAYASRGRLLVSLMLVQELKELGVLMTEKKAVHREIAKLISTDTLNYLSEDGVRVFNSYAHGGFDVLQAWFEDRPQTLATFVQAFKGKFDAALAAATL